MSPFKLSGGEMRRVALAGVLAMKPEYLILDEPTSGMDIKGKKELYTNLKKIHSTGTCVVIVSHQIDDLLPVVNKIVLMDNGKITFAGTPSEYIENISLPVPEITQLMRGLRSKGYNVRNDVLTVDDAYEQIRKLLTKK
jgi:energy-coupling factor transport system ATP-binding protein